GSIDEWRLAGTAFFVGVPSPRHHGRTFIYLVTAKHVASGFFGGPFGVRVNKKDGTATCVRVEGTRWRLHPTESESVDAAVIPVPFPESFAADLDYCVVPTEWFLNDGIIAERDIWSSPRKVD